MREMVGEVEDRRAGESVSHLVRAEGLSVGDKAGNGSRVRDKKI